MSAISEGEGSAEIPETLTDREIRALTERLVVLDRNAPGLFTVFSEEGTEYTVDIHDGGACTCPDVEFNDPEGGCKHQHAARFIVGDRAIPSWVIREEINAQLATRTI